MKMTVRVWPYKGPPSGSRGSEILANVSLTIEDGIVIKNMSVVRAKLTNTIFVSWPSRKDTRTGDYVEIVHPVTAEARKQAIDTILKAYNDMTKPGGQMLVSPTAMSCGCDDGQHEPDCADHPANRFAHPQES